MDASPLYYLCSPECIHSYCWGDQCAVYHAESGDTHLLNKIDLDVLHCINEKPISAKDLSVKFEQAFDGGAIQYIQVLLSSLLGLGLIEAFSGESAR